jgi:hypothetical protein
MFPSTSSSNDGFTFTSSDEEILKDVDQNIS